MNHGCCVDRRFNEELGSDGPGPKGCDKTTCMQLPPGVTCGDCVHLQRCSKLCGTSPDRDYCDFFPRRFTLSSKPAA